MTFTEFNLWVEDVEKTTEKSSEVKELKKIVDKPEKKKEFTEKFMNAILEGNINAEALFDTEVAKAGQEWDERKKWLLERIKGFFSKIGENEWKEDEAAYWDEWYSSDREAWIA